MNTLQFSPKHSVKAMRLYTALYERFPDVPLSIVEDILSDSFVVGIGIKPVFVINVYFEIIESPQFGTTLDSLINKEPQKPSSLFNIPIDWKANDER